MKKLANTASIQTASKYWIVKGNRNNPDRDGDIVTQMIEAIQDIADYQKKRRSNAPEKNIWSQLGKPIDPLPSKGDCVLAWRARQRIGIVGIGRMIDPGEFDYFHREHCFEWEPIQCWSPLRGSKQPDNQFITLEEIRSALSVLPENEQCPTFTQPCVIQTVYPVTVKQAWVLKSLIEKKVKAPSLTPATKKLLGLLEPPHRPLSEHAIRNT